MNRLLIACAGLVLAAEFAVAQGPGWRGMERGFCARMPDDDFVVDKVAPARQGAAKQADARRQPADKDCGSDCDNCPSRQAKSPKGGCSVEDRDGCGSAGAGCDGCDKKSAPPSSVRRGPRADGAEPRDRPRLRDRRAPMRAERARGGYSCRCDGCAADCAGRCDACDRSCDRRASRGAACSAFCARQGDRGCGVTGRYGCRMGRGALRVWG